MYVILTCFSANQLKHTIYTFTYTICKKCDTCKFYHVPWRTLPLPTFRHPVSRMRSGTILGSATAATQMPLVMPPNPISGKLRGSNSSIPSKAPPRRSLCTGIWSSSSNNSLRCDSLKGNRLGSMCRSSYIRLPRAGAWIWRAGNWQKTTTCAYVNHQTGALPVMQDTFAGSINERDVKECPSTLPNQSKEREQANMTTCVFKIATSATFHFDIYRPVFVKKKTLCNTMWNDCSQNTIN